WECRSVRLAFVSTPAETRVAVLVLDGATAPDVGIAAHAFAKRESMPYEVPDSGARAAVAASNAPGHAIAHAPAALAWADTVLVPGYRNPAQAVTSDAVIGALRTAHDRGARIAAISTGAFTLAAAGLLDGKRATTHWHYTRIFRERYPRIEVDENV